MAKRLNTLDTRIQLRPEDLDFLFTQVSDPDLDTRNVSGYDNNLSPGRAFWGTAEQPFLRLTPAQFEPRRKPEEPQRGPRDLCRWATPLAQSAAGQRRDRPAGARRGRQHDQHAKPLWQQPVPDVLRPVLRPRPRLHVRGGGPDLVPIARHERATRGAQLRLNEIRARKGLPPSRST